MQWDMFCWDQGHRNFVGIFWQSHSSGFKFALIPAIVCPPNIVSATFVFSSDCASSTISLAKSDMCFKSSFSMPFFALTSNYKCHGNYFHVKASFSPGFFIFFFFIIIIIESSEVCHYAKFTKSLSYKIDIVGLCWFECRCFPAFTFICLQFKKRFLRFVCFACCLRGPGKLQVGALPI